MKTPKELKQIALAAPTALERILNRCEEASKEGKMSVLFPHEGFAIDYRQGADGMYSPCGVAVSDDAKRLIELLNQNGFKAESYCLTLPEHQAGISISWEGAA